MCVCVFVCVRACVRRRSNHHRIIVIVITAHIAHVGKIVITAMYVIIYYYDYY